MKTDRLNDEPLSRCGLAKSETTLTEMKAFSSRTLPLLTGSYWRLLPVVKVAVDPKRPHRELPVITGDYQSSVEELNTVLNAPKPSFLASSSIRPASRTSRLVGK